MLMVDGAVEKNVVITYSTHPEKKNKIKHVRVQCC